MRLTTNMLREKALASLKTLENTIIELERKWDRLDNNGRDVEKFEVEQQLEECYSKQHDLKNFLEATEEKQTNNKT